MHWLNNICWLSDSYKVSHWKQYPARTKRVYSYFEPRTGAKYDENIIFEQSPTAGSLAESNSTITVWYHVVYSGLQKKYETLL